MAKINNTKFNRRFNAILLIGIVFSILTIFGLVNNPNNNQDIRSRASVEDDANYCVNPPECCARMAQSHDAHECDWPIRGYCNNCGDIEGKNERCGWYWIWHNKDDNEYKIGTNAPDGYGCMIGYDEGSMRPKYVNGKPITLGPQVTATSVPIPTAIPSAIPTVLPTVILPTSFPTSQPTEIPTRVPNPNDNVAPSVYIPPTLYIYPTMTPVPTFTPTPTPKLFSLPDILSPKEKVVSFIESIKFSLTSFLSKVLP